MSDDTFAPAGHRGTRLYSPKRLLINPALLKRTAVLKTADFSLVTADFDGERIAFQPWLSLRLVERDRIVSWAVYQPAFPSDEPASEPSRPDVVWRRAEWDRLRDIDRFRAAPDKSAYLLGDTQIDSSIQFGRLAERPRLATAVREGIEVLAAGVQVIGVSRPDVAWENLRVNVLADELVMNLDYAPWLTMCGEVEGWAERWSTMIDSWDEAGAMTPDGDITVSREDSYEELVDRVRRFPQPVIDSFLAAPS